jgi:allantoicase
LEKTKPSRRILPELKRREMIDSVIQIIGHHKEGLTWADVVARADKRLPRHLLTRMQAEGYIKVRKKLLPDGRIAKVYVLVRTRKA